MYQPWCDTEKPGGRALSGRFVARPPTALGQNVILYNWHTRLAVSLRYDNATFNVSVSKAPRTWTARFLSDI